MLNSIIVGGDADLVRYLRQVCAEFADVCVYKILATTARRYEIATVLNAYALDVVFLDVSDLESPDSIASVCLEELLPQHSQTAVVPFSNQPRMLASQDDPALPLPLGPTLTPPFNAEQLERTVREALRRNRPTSMVSKVMAFLPAKPGAGATTVAVNIAGAAAATFQQKTLIIEADLNSGAIAYMLNLQPTAFVSEAIGNPRMLAEIGWDKMVSRSHGIDILPACGAPQMVRGSRWDFYRLVKFAREQYEVVIVDLPALIDEIAEAVIAEADKVVLVCTPETPSLSMVRRRLWELESRGVRLRHLQVLVNRHAPGDPEPGEMVAITQHEVAAVLPEDAFAVKSASRCNGLVNSDSRLLRSMVCFAGDLLGLEPPASRASPFALFKKFMSRALGHSSQGAFESSAHTRLEASSACYHSGGRRQLDRW